MDAKHHLREALRGNIAETDGNIYLAKRLNAETKLRLIRMSDEELWRLADNLISVGAINCGNIFTL